MAPTMTTLPQAKHVVLYDGLCKFCTAQSRNLLALARRDAIELVNFQETGVLERFPGLTHEECMKAMCLVTPEGRVHRGFEAAVRAVATRPLLKYFAYLYFVPGIRQLCDAVYRWVAANRYRIMGKVDECAGGTCALHFRPPTPRENAR